MTEKELFIECIPQITEMMLEVQKMTTWEYLGFKEECLKETGRTCPVALEFIKKIFILIELCFAE